jgi:hypothetical protein
LGKWRSKETKIEEESTFILDEELHSACKGETLYYALFFSISQNENQDAKNT